MPARRPRPRALPADGGSAMPIGMAPWLGRLFSRPPSLRAAESASAIWPRARRGECCRRRSLRPWLRADHGGQCQGSAFSGLFGIGLEAADAVTTGPLFRSPAFLRRKGQTRSAWSWALYYVAGWLLGMRASGHPGVLAASLYLELCRASTRMTSKIHTYQSSAIDRWMDG